LHAQSTTRACCLDIHVQSLSIIADTPDSAEHISRSLAPVFATRSFRRDRLSQARSTKYTIVDIDLANSSSFSDLRQWLKQPPASRIVLFAVDDGVRHQAVQAHALGATDLIARPLDRAILLKKLVGDISALLSETPALANGRSAGIAAGATALQGIFAAACLGAPLDPASIDQAGGTVVSHIEDDGLVHWIDIVRKHHGQTYQHCLLVTGVAVAFGKHLGFSAVDRRKLAMAGLLHDVGKAKIPLAILEKAGPLDAREVEVMKQHPILGWEALQDVPGLAPEMLDMVVHHHEYLDGSGYPHGLQANKLSDFVRLVTISDIFGALIERRAYKAPLSGEAAYRLLESMGDKLDRHILRAFRPIAQMARA
jgi:putative nucleotidyltransferase with HDIG domain